MSNLPGQPLVWSPHGASDTLDSSTAFNGAMSLLQDLIPDPSTKDLWQCRPAAFLTLSLAGAGFNTPTFVSCFMIVGTYAYGMVSTARNPGQDEPFAFNLLTNTIVPITGVTVANTPISPQQSGLWSPPNMALVGPKIIVAHPGFTGAGGAFFGVLDISNPAAPTWTATNTAPTALVVPPTWVSNFNGRCFFLVNPPAGQPAAYMSDSLVPTTITNGNQILTFGDNQPLTCAAGLPLENQLGGIIQSLIIFKGVNNLFQVTGDYALQNLAVNSLNVATGTFAPNTVHTTSQGIAFIAPDGLRVIDFTARVSDPIGVAGDGITAPFFSALTPSRMCAAYNGGVYRVQVQNGGMPGNPQQQWWFDFTRTVWSGPHTQAADLMAAYNNTFLVTLQGAGAKLWQSDQVQDATSTYVENGRQLQYQFATPMLPDTDQMAEVSMVQATLHVALVSGAVVTVSAQNQDMSILDTVTIAASGGQTLWGAFLWGQALWQGLQAALYPRRLNWHFPIVFRRMGILASGQSVQGLKIGRLHMRYQVLNYLQQDG